MVRGWVDARGTAKRGRITAVKAAFTWADEQDEIPFNPIRAMKGLEVRHLDLINDRGILEVEESKGAQLSRFIFLTPRAERIIHRSLRPGSSVVFLNTRGNIWTSNAIRSLFRRLQNKIGDRSSQYAFRHTFATRMLMRGKSAIVVAKLLGHADPSMIAKTYQHVAQIPEYT